MKAVFLRALEESKDKAAVLREAIGKPMQTLGCTRFEIETESFEQVPRSPFDYWAGASVLDVFRSAEALERDNRNARIGLSTSDDYRFVRLSWEVGAQSRTWRFWLFAKGGGFSPIYADIHLVLHWEQDGRELKAWVTNNPTDPNTTHWSRRIANSEFFQRPGLTWPLRTTSGLSLRAMPAGCVFGHKGPAVFVSENTSQHLLVLLAVTNSRAFRSLVELQLAAADAAARSYEVGVIQRTPVPLQVEKSIPLGTLARTAWSLKRAQDTSTENSHAFHLPAILQLGGSTLSIRAANCVNHIAQTISELDVIQTKIDDLCFELYGISHADRNQIEQGFGNSRTSAGEDDADDTGDFDLSTAPLVAALLSWSIGVAFGRFDLRLATDERPVLPTIEPFEPLPVCAPGILTGEEGFPVDAPPPSYPIGFPADGILVDDPGAAADLVDACRRVFTLVFDDPDANWEEAAVILNDRKTGLRTWLAKQFFDLHIKHYSKSRRKAPIYWQLATPSASYAAWLYYHRFSRDTLFRLLNDHVTPKLQHEERKLTNLTQEAGPEPSSSQRKEISSQEAFVGELRAFRDEVARVAPLWNPNLNDGVILNFAPLWRLVPQHKGWQKECKAAWDRLCKGEFDWAHLAMHLWPERVVPKCAKDRSLAIAHELEGVFWKKDVDGKWLSKAVPEETVASNVADRMSAAVKGALKDLLEAPTPAKGRGKAPRRKPTNPRRSRGSVSSRKTNEDVQPQLPLVDPTVVERVRSAIAQLGGNAAKAEILEVAGLSSSQWNSTINALLADGSVTKSGQKRGTRYHLAGGSS
jgi:hypothetical protein